MGGFGTKLNIVGAKSNVGLGSKSVVAGSAKANDEQKELERLIHWNFNDYDVNVVAL